MPSSRISYDVVLHGFPVPVGPTQQIGVRLYQVGRNGSNRHLFTFATDSKRCVEKIQCKTFERIVNLEDDCTGGISFAPDVFRVTLESRRLFVGFLEVYASSTFNLAHMLALCGAVGESCSATIPLEWQAIAPTAARSTAPSLFYPFLTSATVNVTRVKDFEIEKSGSSAAFVLRHAARRSIDAVDLKRCSVWSNLSRSSLFGESMKYAEQEKRLAIYKRIAACSTRPNSHLSTPPILLTCFI